MDKAPKQPPKMTKLKRGSIKFLDKYASDPKLGPSEAYLMTHKTTNKNTASASASKILAKPAAQLYLKKHRKLARDVKLEVLANARAYPEKVAYQKLANDIAEQMLDRIEGKPIQKTENTNHNVNLNIEASQELADAFTAFIKQQTVQH